MRYSSIIRYEDIILRFTKPWAFVAARRRRLISATEISIIPNARRGFRERERERETERGRNLSFISLLNSGRKFIIFVPDRVEFYAIVSRLISTVLSIQRTARRQKANKNRDRYRSTETVLHSTLETVPSCILYFQFDVICLLETLLMAHTHFQSMSINL